MATDERKFRTCSIFWSGESIEADGNKRPKKKNAVKKNKIKLSENSQLGIHTAKNSMKELDKKESQDEIPKEKQSRLRSNGEKKSSHKQENKEDEIIFKAKKEHAMSTVPNASLKDLCAEDKKRVANLIQELARLGEEKETVAELLTNERELFEDKINDLVAQQDTILKEREEIQKQLNECQELIGKYQKVLAESRPENTSSNATESKRKKTDAVANRPFTSMIDKMITEQKQTPTDRNDRELKLGPLVNPKFESTLTREVDFESDEFQPLQGESATTIASTYSKHGLTQSSGECHLHRAKQTDPVHTNQDVKAMNRSNNMRSTTVNPQVSTALPQASSNLNPMVHTEGSQLTLIPSNLDDEEFFKFYRELKPDQRKQQLFMQKQSLLVEQERLKAILEEQEKLLHLKKEKLRDQQDTQQNRLLYFERNGHFPQHYSQYTPLYGNSSYSSSEMTAQQFDGRNLQVNNSCQNAIPSFNSMGAPVNHVGAPINPIGPPINPIGPPRSSVGAPLNPMGPPISSIGAPVNPIGPPISSIRAPLNPIGPALNSMGPPVMPGWSRQFAGPTQYNLGDPMYLGPHQPNSFGMSQQQMAGIQSSLNSSTGIGRGSAVVQDLPVPSDKSQSVHTLGSKPQLGIETKMTQTEGSKTDISRKQSSMTTTTTTVQEPQKTHKSQHKSQKKVFPGTNGESMGRLLDLVVEADSLYNEVHLDDPLEPYLTPSRREVDNDSPIPMDLFQHLDELDDYKTVHRGQHKSAAARKVQYHGHLNESVSSGKSHGSSSGRTDQDDLDESHVLEDVFFIK